MKAALTGFSILPSTLQLPQIVRPSDHEAVGVRHYQDAHVLSLSSSSELFPSHTFLAGVTILASAAAVHRSHTSKAAVCCSCVTSPQANEAGGASAAQSEKKEAAAKFKPKAGPRRAAQTFRSLGSAALAQGGVFAVDKPKGMSSAEVVERILEQVQSKFVDVKIKAGHGGTLDPEATGVLVIGIGAGTRMLKAFLEGPKAYSATVTMGVETDTQDAAGKPIATAPFEQVTADSIQALLPVFTGEILQVPPMYSALHFNGQRLYKLAMQGMQVEREPRKVVVHKLELVRFQPPTFSIYVECGGGLYVRTLGNDLAKQANTVGHVSSLRRVQVGAFKEEDCLSFEEALSVAKIASRLRTVQKNFDSNELQKDAD